MARARGHEVIPSARRLIRSLRDMGYDFSTAVADLIDNSIEAGATQIMIDVEFKGDDSYVRIADNGLGMTLEQLKEAMRYGSEREYDGEEDLGKFGLGLKTASMSQCQILVVASRCNANLNETHAYSWDMDHVESTNKWEIISVPKRRLKFVLGNYLDHTTGTVVLWQRLDRILGYRHPYGENAKKRLVAMCRDLEAHLAMVFHRFLAGEVPGKKLRIVLNGNQIQPWDPFARTEINTRCLNSKQIRLEHEGRVGKVILESYVLPHQDDFSSRDAFNLASGPKKWNRQQGFYIYRANRLIQSGGWSGLRTNDEHTKLARIAMSFTPHMDEAFKINVSKMRVQLPVQIREHFETATKPVVKLAQETYRRKTQKRSGSPMPKPANQATDGQNSDPSGSMGAPTVTSPSNKPAGVSVDRYWTLEELVGRLEALAEPEEKPVLLKIIRRLRETLKK